MTGLVDEVTGMSGVMTLLGASRDVEWRSDQSHMRGNSGVLLIKGLFWKDAERILAALRTHTSYLTPSLADIAVNALIKPDALPSALDKLDSPQAVETSIPETAPVEQVTGNGSKQIDDSLPWEETPKSKQPVVDEDSDEDSDEDELEIPEDVRRATQLRIVLTWLQENGYKDEDALIEAVVSLNRTTDEGGKPLIPLVAKLDPKNIPDRVKRQLAVMA